MNYFGYVVAAYTVFFVVLLWDMLAAHWQVRRALRQARAKQRRQRNRAAAADVELLR